MTNLQIFLSDEDGAVTVDWVVLTAAVVALAALVAPAIKEPVDDQADNIAAVIDAAG